LTIRQEPPVVKQELTKARSFNPFQKLLGNNLIRINIRPIKRNRQAGVNSK